MSHGIRKNAITGLAEMAYVGETPWHELGQKLEPGAALEVWKIAAGMSWEARRAFVRYFIDDTGAPDAAGFERMMHCADKTVLFRSDTGAPLGIVSPDYEIVQPGEVLEFFRDLVANSGYALETAGVIFGGKKLWAQARIAEETVSGADKVGGFLLLSTSLDGSAATEGRETTTRVVCRNTLAMAQGEKVGAGKVIRVPHRSKFNADAMKKRLDATRENFAAFMDVARVLAQVKVTDAGAQDFVRQLLRPNEYKAEQVAKQAAEAARIVAEASAAAGSSGVASEMAALLSRSVKNLSTTADDAKTRAPRGEGKILQFFKDSPGADMETAKGTAWGLVNAVTHYVDFHSTAQSADHRANAAWFGAGDELKTAALNQAMALV